MQHLDEGTIHAWLDGQLPRDEAQAVEAHVADCRQCADAVAEARGLIAASSRILLSLDGVPREVVPTPASRGPTDTGTAPAAAQPRTSSLAKQRAQRRWFRGPSFAAAAAVVVAVGTFALMRAASRPKPASNDVAEVPTATSGPSAESAMSRAAVPATIPPAVPAPAPLGSPRPRPSPQQGVAAAGDARSESAATPKREVAEPAAQQASAKTIAAGVVNEGLADRADVRRPAVASIPASAADEMKKASRPESALSVEKAKRDTIITIRGRAALSTRIDSAAPPAAAVNNAPTATGVVHGRVTDANSTGLVGAMVSVAGTTTGVATNAAGEFTLSGLPPGAHRLTVRRIGYGPVDRDVTIAAGQTVTADMVLSPAVNALESVVVTGTAGTQPRPFGSARAAAPAPALETPPGAPITAAQSNAVGCYAFSITPTTAQARTGFLQVPRRVALDSEIVPSNAEGVWYRARDLSRVGTLPDGLWRPAGPDGIELEWTYGSRTDRVRLSGPASSVMRGTIEEIDRATATGEPGTVVALRRPCEG